jgi:rare lipoprotein A
MKRVEMKQITAVLILLFLMGCGGNLMEKGDSAPSNPPDVSGVLNAVPKNEKIRSDKLKSYVVLGKRYYQMSTNEGYSEKGIASWYGKKFHGRKTATGEIYDMYQMTAAHKTLPLPSYAEVTNLNNGLKIIVRVNDRGPFHSGRVIDLSYAAALKLGVLKTGVTDVQLDVIHVDKAGKITVGRFPTINNKDTNISNQRFYIQVVALQNKTQIDKLASALKILYQRPFETRFEQGIYKLHLGPIKNEHETDNLLNELKSNDYPSAYKVYFD